MRGKVGVFLRGKNVAECVEYEYVGEGELGADGVVVRANETWCDVMRLAVGAEIKRITVIHLRCAYNTTEHTC